MIEVCNLTKIYNTGKGVFNIDFTVNDGEVFGFLGPNGAGKTTTIRQLLGFTNATGGKCLINGLDTRNKTDEINRDLGYLPGEIAFLDHMTGMDFLLFIAHLRGIKHPTRMDELISRFDLEADRKLRKMSKGMKQKVALVSAFMHDPQILILDEPTSGLDPLMQQRFIEMIIEEKKRGKTILMSSHLFEEVERTSDRVAIIKDGRIVAIETVATLKAGARKTYRVSVGSEKDRDKIIASGLSVTEVAPLLFEIMIKNDFKEMFEVLRTVDVVNLESFEQTLEKVFIHYYEKGGN